MNEDDTYSKSVIIDLQAVFKTIGTISSIVELTLAANLPLSDMHRLDWIADDQRLSDTAVTSKGLSLWMISFFYSSVSHI
jgi:hypothetical protein